MAELAVPRNGRAAWAISQRPVINTRQANSVGLPEASRQWRLEGSAIYSRLAISLLAAIHREH